jgi:hypothetical protein
MLGRRVMRPGGGPGVVLVWVVVNVLAIMLVLVFVLVFKVTFEFAMVLMLMRFVMMIREPFPGRAFILRPKFLHFPTRLLILRPGLVVARRLVAKKPTPICHTENFYSLLKNSFPNVA